MFTPDEAAFLRAIADAGEDNAPRLVFADWLDDRRQGERAEFIRVQCELVSGKMPKKRRQALRERERALLDVHRKEWCKSFGLPVEDVGFERGLISRMRLSRWDGDQLLAVAPQLATLTELDLSGLGIEDDKLESFLESLWPALRKLILSGNGITDRSVESLVTTSRLPLLDTLYLFDTGIRLKFRTRFEHAAGFRLKTLDAGERKDGYCMSPGEADLARRQQIRKQILPVVQRHFKAHPRLQSAMLCVAQYWADEADDAVHGTLVVSELFEPTLVGVRGDIDEDGPDPNIPNTPIKSKYSERPTSEVGLWEDGVHWDDNSGAIPVWAAFAPEAGSQEYDQLGEAYAPAVMYYRHGGYDILPMARPHLDGVRPEWSEEE